MLLLKDVLFLKGYSSDIKNIRTAMLVDMRTHFAKYSISERDHRQTGRVRTGQAHVIYSLNTFPASHLFQLKEFPEPIH